MPGIPLPRWLSVAILLAIATVFGSNHIGALVVAGAVIALGTAKR